MRRLLTVRNVLTIPGSQRAWDGLWLALLIGYVLAGVWWVPFHGDESTQIYMSRDYAYQFIQRDLTLIYYSPTPASPQEQDLRIINGTLNKYTIGLVWHVAGLSLDDINQQWDWGADYDYNVRTGHHPGEPLLWIARLPSALFTAAGVVIAFAVGRMVGGGYLAAYAVSLFYATNPALLVNGRRAMMEGSLLFGALLVLLAGLVWVQSSRRYWPVVFLGAAMGIALAAKHTNLFAVVSVVIGCAVSVLMARQPGRLLPLMLAGVVGAVVFLLLNPAWWSNPLGTATEILRLRTTLLQIQTDVFGQYAGIGEQLAGFWRQGVVGRPMYYEVVGWEGTIGGQILRYEATGLAGFRVPAWLFAPLSAIGLVSVIRGHGTLARWVVLAWVLLPAALTLLLTPLEWQRYYLPAVLGLCLLAGFGTASLLHFLFAHLPQRPSNRDPATPSTSVESTP